MTIRAIYSTTPSKDWIDVAQRLYTSHKVVPTYWINHDFKSDIEKEFENTIVHDSIDAIQGRSPDEYDFDSFSVALDSEILSQFQEYESIVLKMMDRMDTGNVTGADFTYTERIRHYHRQLSYWIQVVDDIEPDVVVFGAAPHLIYDYLLYAVCKQYDVETLIYTHCSLPARFFVRKSINESPVQTNDLYGETPDIPPDLMTYVQKLRGKYSQAEPEYMKTDTRQRSIRGLLDDGCVYGKRIYHMLSKIHKIFDRKRNSYIKRKEETIEDSHITQREWIQYRLKSRYYRHKLKKKYENSSIKPNYSDDYIYFPLHYQPERTTSPEGGQYVHQNLAIQLLSLTLSSDMSIYVKEHPSQFSSRLKGEQGRQLSYYKHLDKIPNVEIACLDSNSFNLIDNSLAVATITGTAGWESLVRGTPAIVFGNAWYQNAPGCYHVKTKKKMRVVLESIYQNNSLDINNIYHFISKAESIGYHGALNSSENNHVDSLYTSFSENCEKIS